MPRSRNWTNPELKAMLSVAQEVLPTGNDMWCDVSVGLLEAGRNMKHPQVWNRSWKTCRNKYRALVRSTPPTGASEMAPIIHLAKSIDKAAEAAEAMGHAAANNSLNDVEDSDDETVLSGTNLFKGDGTPRRPHTRGTKIEILSNAVNDLASANQTVGKDVANKMGALVDALTGAGSTSAGTMPRNTSSLERRIATVETTVEGMSNSFAGLADEMRHFMAQLEAHRPVPPPPVARAQRLTTGKRKPSQDRKKSKRSKKCPERFDEDPKYMYSR